MNSKRCWRKSGRISRRRWYLMAFAWWRRKVISGGRNRTWKSREVWKRLGQSEVKIWEWLLSQELERWCVSPWLLSSLSSPKLQTCSGPQLPDPQGITTPCFSYHLPLPPWPRDPDHSSCSPSLLLSCVLFFLLLLPHFSTFLCKERTPIVKTITPVRTFLYSSEFLQPGLPITITWI